MQEKEKIGSLICSHRVWRPTVKHNSISLIIQVYAVRWTSSRAVENNG